MNNDIKQFNTLEELLASMNPMNPIQFQFKEPGKQMEQIMSKQMTALDQVRQGGYIVGSIDANATVSFSGTPRIHNTTQEARLECKRLAASQPGKAFIFVKLAGAELVPQATAVSI